MLLPRVVPIALALLAGSCSGEGGAGRDEDGRITEAGRVSVFDLRVGDCLDPHPAADGQLVEVEVVPCEEPHTQEVFALVEHDADEYPGEAEILAFADASCLDAFPRYTGADYAESELAFSYLHPSEASWNEADDRTVVCVIVAPEEGKTASARASSTTTTSGDGEGG